jgi:hypothetical protein
MGAYSSWAGLALTHHVIVQLAATLSGKVGFTAYAILGDDIVIADEEVALEYHKLMTALGVSINLSKSLISTEFAEFAKRWVGPNVELTPIGPGLILRTVRNRFYIGALLTSMFRIGLLPNLDAVLAAIRALPTEFQSGKA